MLSYSNLITQRLNICQINMKIQAIATVRGFALPDNDFSPNEKRNLEIELHDGSPRLTVRIGERVINNVGLIGSAIRTVAIKEYTDLNHFMQTWGNLILAQDLSFQ